MPRLLRACIAEFIGTFALVFVAAGAVLAAQAEELSGIYLIGALANAAVLTVFVNSCLYLSGSQFNPAVSIALLVARRQTPATAAAYIVSQLLAAASGAGMLVLLHGPDVANASVTTPDGLTNVGATIGSMTVAGNTLGVFGFEMIMTFALMLVIMGAVVDRRAERLSGPCVGLVVAACVLVGGPFTGASMNPARTFGPAIYGHWDMHWVYWAAPITGACLAALVYGLVWAEPQTDQPTRSN